MSCEATKLDSDQLLDDLHVTQSSDFALPINTLTKMISDAELRCFIHVTI